ncbi:MAG: type 2 isopentenyl-diphosphate Delta-isomerase [Euryarchaeota archaeon]|nr:type 2 isopentenyl-diphosphate Delta-isomerase [Euryarchaeota archaeon]
MIDARKLDHILISLKKDVASKTKNGFEDVALVHRALPEIDREEIDLSATFFGRRISAPVLIAGMTGGHEKAKKINENLAIAAQELNIPMGVGSQRAGIENEKLAYTYSIAREAAPDAFLIANLGAVQLSKGYGIKEARKAIDMIGANALAVHLNPLHEAIQPEGETDFKGCIRGIEKLSNIGVPIIAKETGAGIAREEAVLLEKAGVAGIDVGGLGGTSFSAVEYYRKKAGKGKLFWDWGIPTAISTVECAESTKLQVIATGGIRNGIEVAKALALGASACGIALPLLRRAVKSSREVAAELQRIIEELKTATFLVGAANVAELKNSDVVITGKMKEWLESRGIDCKKFANRRMIKWK